jgi:hypothetical protein
MPHDTLDGRKRQMIPLLLPFAHPAFSSVRDAMVGQLDLTTAWISSAQIAQTPLGAARLQTGPISLSASLTAMSISLLRVMALQLFDTQFLPMDNIRQRAQLPDY